jgi:hypothetical protein
VFSSAQLREFTARTIKNQHDDDALLERYERVERDSVHGSGKGVSNKDTLSYLVPTGTGSMRVELERDGKPSDATAREQQWERIRQKLQANTRPDDPEIKRDYEKAAHRNHERYEMVEAVGRAFHFQCVHRQNVQGRYVLEIAFEPDPSFHSSLRFSGVFAHVRGTVWIDEAAAQIVRLQGELFEDYSVGGGLVARLYRGGTASLEQHEVEPGVWMPARTSFDLRGRLFLFPAIYHELIEASAYRRVGSPHEALLLVSQEHAGSAQKP